MNLLTGASLLALAKSIYYLQLILRVSWANRSDTPFEVGGISTAIFLCITKPTPFMAGVAADAIQIMETVV